MKRITPAEAEARWPSSMVWFDTACPRFASNPRCLLWERTFYMALWEPHVPQKTEVRLVVTIDRVRERVVASAAGSRKSRREQPPQLTIEQRLETLEAMWIPFPPSDNPLALSGIWSLARSPDRFDQYGRPSSDWLKWWWPAAADWFAL